MSPPFQRLLLSFWQLIIADIQRIELISVLTTLALSFGNGEVFFCHKVVVMNEISAIFFNLGFLPNLCRIDLRQDRILRPNGDELLKK